MEIKYIDEVKVFIKNIPSKLKEMFVPGSMIEILISFVILNEILVVLIQLPALLVYNLMMVGYGLAYIAVRFLIVRTWNYFRKNENDSIILFFRKGIASFFQLMIFATILIGGLIAFDNSNPYTLKEYTIKNNDGREIVFQQMMHIATPKFYDFVKSNVDSHSKDGYKVYYEQVTPDKDTQVAEDSQEKFDKIMKFTLDKNTYSSLSKTFGLTNQQNKELYKDVATGSLVNADTTITKIVGYYENKYGEDYKDNQVITSQEGGMALAKVSEIYQYLTPIGRTYLQGFFKSILSQVQQHDKFVSFVQDSLGMKQVMDSILNFRNDIIVNDYINGSGKDDKKIYITYGGLHFTGVLKLLQSQDNSWKVTSTREVAPLK